MWVFWPKYDPVLLHFKTQKKFLTWSPLVPRDLLDRNSHMNKHLGYKSGYLTNISPELPFNVVLSQTRVDLLCFQISKC